RLLVEEGAQLLVGAAQLERQVVPEAPVDLYAELGVAADDLVELARRETQQVAGVRGDGVARALGAGEEVDLAEEIARLEQAEREGAVRRAALDGDLALLEHVEVGPRRALGENEGALLVLLLG